MGFALDESDETHFCQAIRGRRPVAASDCEFCDTEDDDE